VSREDGHYLECGELLGPSALGLTCLPDPHYLIPLGIPRKNNHLPDPHYLIPLGIPRNHSLGYTKEE